MKNLTKPKVGQPLRLFTLNNAEGRKMRNPENPADTLYFSDKMVAKAHKPDVTFTVGYGPDHHQYKG
jgi:hypothetical protein